MHPTVLHHGDDTKTPCTSYGQAQGTTKTTRSAISSILYDAEAQWTGLPQYSGIVPALGSGATGQVLSPPQRGCQEQLLSVYPTHISSKVTMRSKCASLLMLLRTQSPLPLTAITTIVWSLFDSASIVARGLVPAPLCKHRCARSGHITSMYHAGR